MSFTIESIGIVGAGAMGTGIAESCALSGFRTTVIKATAGRTAPVIERIRASLAARVDRGGLSVGDAAAALARITVSADRDALTGSELVIESVLEDLVTKRELFADLDSRLPDHAVLASNTSSLRIADLAASIRDQRTIGLHFFPPVPTMALVEVAPLPTTDADVAPAIAAFVRRLGKTAVPVLDSTGFVVNRLLVPMLLNAIHAYGQGLAPAELIDTAMQLGCGHPMGPLALADRIGLDAVYAMAKLLHHEFHDGCYRPPALLRRMVQQGHLGTKVGRGIYDYSTKPPRANADVWAMVRSGVAQAA